MLSTLKNLEYEFAIGFLLQYKQISFASAKLINRIVSAAYDVCRRHFVVVRYQFEINHLIFLQYLYSGGSASLTCTNNHSAVAQRHVLIIHLIECV